MKDDILFTIAGTIGRVAIVTADLLPANTNQAVAIVRPDRSRVQPRFLMYALQDAQQLHQALGRAVQSVQANLSLTELGALRLRVPPLPNQRAIAEVLGALDDKIAANSRLSLAADQLASAMAKRAFDSTSMLGDVAGLVMGTSPTGATMNERGDGVVFFQGVRDFGIRVPKSRVFTLAPIKMAAPGDVLISVRAPVGRVNRADRGLCIGRGLAAARSKTPSALLHALKQATIWESFNGEGTVFGSINQMDLRRAQIPWSTNDEIARLELTLAPLESRIDQAEAESTRLADLRDNLLPHLMSGRISVREAEKAVEEVL